MVDNTEYPSGGLIPGTKYKVIRKLGAGGMGTVYEVEDTTIDKRYVLKTLHSQFSARADLAERMDKEAKALARLEHKNIVQVITADVTADALKLRYFVMEKLSGHSLRTVLDNKGSLEVEAACRLMIDVLNALYHAHEHRIVHRDVKPDNIFLHRDRDGVTVPKLLDFGVMTSSDQKTMTGHRFIGTLRYAAPEQLVGDKVSPQTDIYAAGLVLYEAIAGRGPFDNLGDSMAVASGHLHNVPPNISTFKPVPSSVEQIIMSALAKDPNQRPRDAFAFAADLNRACRALRSAQPSNASEMRTVEAILPMTAPPSTPIMANRGGPAPTAKDGPLRGATTPAVQGMAPQAQQPHAQPPHAQAPGTDNRMAPMSRAGHTLEDASPPDMTVGQRAPLAAAPAVDRSAPTTTYVADSPQGPTGDTVLMDPSEQRQSRDTVRMAPQAVLTAPQPPPGWMDPNALPSTASSSTAAGTLSHSVPDAQIAGLRTRKPPWGVVVAVVGGTVVALSVMLAVGLHFKSNGKAAPNAEATVTPSVSAPASTILPAATAASADVAPTENAPAVSATAMASASEAKPAVVVAPPPPRTPPKPVAASAAPPKLVPPPVAPVAPAAADSVVVPKKKKLPPSGL